MDDGGGRVHLELTIGDVVMVIDAEQSSTLSLLGYVSHARGGAG